jgi:hypothetical protein
MYYYLYKITNTVNNKIYIGIHQTNNLDDEYFGSGLMLHRAINKYGKCNFFKEIIEYFDSSEAMAAREKQIVNSKFVKSTRTYNIVEGGLGSFSYINSLPNQGHSKQQQCKAAKLAGTKHKEKMLVDTAYRENWIIANARSQSAKWESGRIGNTKGTTVWISHYDLQKSYCINSSLYPHYYDQGWSRGRKFRI